MRLYFLLLLFAVFFIRPLMADETPAEYPQEYPPQEYPQENYQQENPQPEYPPEYNQPPSTETGDIVMDYRSLIQKIDEMRVHEEEVLRKLEDLSRSYEDGLKKLEDTQKELEDELQDLKAWHEKEADRLANISGGSGPVEIKGEIRGAPSDRYTSSY
jgi:hypothetical protein